MQTERSKVTLSTKQRFSILLVAGAVFLVAQNVEWLFQLLPAVSFQANQHLGSLIATIMIFVGISGFFWDSTRSFFRRWYRNRDPVTFDLCLIGATAGLAVAISAQLISQRAWELRPDLTGYWCALVATGLLGACLHRLDRMKRNRSEIGVSDASGSVKMTDDPLPDLTPETDAFARNAFLDEFAAAVHRSDPDTCHVVALVGPWGSGKTTLLKAVAKRCQPAFRVIEIDSWAFRETGRLTEAILTSIVQDIDGRYFFPDLRRILGRYLAIISSAAKKLSALEALSKALVDSEGLERLKKRLEVVVRSTQERYLVVIDDVDRLDPSELHSLLKTVRLCASIPRVVHVLAYDRASIYRILAPGNASVARDFMDKIVEDEWVLPLIPTDSLRKYLATHLPRADSARHERFSRDFEERLEKYFPAIRQLLNTPRHIKRVAIALSRRSLIVSRLNPFDAFLWEIMRQRQPVIYDLVLRKPWLLRPDRSSEGNWVMKMFMDKKRGEKEEKEIDDLITKSSDASEAVRELFWALFPKGERDPERSEKDWLRLRRICHETFFNAYFLLESFATEKGPAEMDALVGKINKADSPETARDVVAKSLEAALQSGWLADWIPLLRVFSEDINVERLRSVIDGIRDSSRLVSESTGQNAGECLRALAQLNVILVGRLPSDTDATAVVASLLTETPSLPMASIYAHYLLHERQGYGQRSPDAKTCSALFDARLEKELMSLGPGVFEKPLSQVATLMFYHSDSSKVYDFLEKAAGFNAQYWARFVFHLVLFWSNGSREINSEVIGIVPVKTLTVARAALDGADMSGWADHEAQAALAFVEQWRPPGGPSQAPSNMPQPPGN